MTQRVLVMPRVEQQDACDWQQIALGMAALVANTRGHRDDALSDLAQHLRPAMTALRASAARLEATAAEQAGVNAARDLTLRIVEQTDLMGRCVNAMLEVQRIRLGKLHLDVREVDLVEIVRQSALDFRDVQVRVMASGPLVVRGDACRLRQVINAVLRALASMDGCEEVTLRVRLDRWPRHAPDPPLDLELFVARELIRLHGGELWTNTGGSMLVLPVQFPPLSHVILASNARCCRAA
jgi:K+-sensing histidine kinase KdpD